MSDVVEIDGNVTLVKVNGVTVYSVGGSGAAHVNATIVNTPTPGVVEGTPMPFNVTLDQACASTVTLHFHTLDSASTVLPNVQYTPIADQLLTFNPGETLKTVNVTTINDHSIEANGSICAGIFNPSSNVTIKRAAGSGRLIDAGS